MSYYGKTLGFFRTLSNYDADAQAYFTAAGITDTGEKNAWNTFVTTGKGNGIYSKLLYFWPFLGLTSTTQSWCSITAITGSRLSWSNTSTHNTSGVIFNSSSASVGSLTGTTTSNKGVGAYISGLESFYSAGGPAYVMDAGSAGGSVLITNGHVELSYLTYLDTNNFSYDFGQIETSLISFHTLSDAGNDNKIYLGSTLQDSYETSDNTAFNNIYFGDLDDVGNDLTFGCLYVSQGLTSSEMITLNTMINTLMSGLGR